LSAKRKLHPVEQSSLFRLRGKGRFAQVLGVEWDAVTTLLESEGYRVWINAQGREIQAPVNWLASVHATLGKLLSRIELPEYLHSKKGCSYVTNAAQHRGVHPVIKTDISRFYPSVTRSMVFGMFHRDFECSADVADRLADICCFQQRHLPTGSTISGRVAFFAAKPMFDEIARMAANVGCTMTVYVDDITISGEKADKRLLAEVRACLVRYGLKSKTEKSKSFAATLPKTITGAVVVNNEIRLPNHRHKQLFDARQAVFNAVGDTKRSLQRQVMGREQEAAQIASSNPDSVQ
jgi:Reverse transcriptase (RNA-dependent DNA polymerase)